MCQDPLALDLDGDGVINAADQAFAPPVKFGKMQMGMPLSVKRWSSTQKPFRVEQKELSTKN
jgi:hypothetical protein